jgi:hypothetical protein
LRIGADKPWKVGLAIALAVLSLVLVLRAFLSPPTQQAATPTPATTQQTPAAQRRRGARGAHPQQPGGAPADPRLRLDLLTASETVNYTGSGRNIFRSEGEEQIARVIKRPIPAPQPAPQPPPQPVPQVAPITLRFFGFANRPGEPKRIFLADGDSVFVASEGDVVARRYKVQRIGVNSVEIQDLLNNATVTLPLSQG